MNQKFQTTISNCKFFLVLFFFTGVFTHVSFAQEFFVSPLGNDRNDGTEANPLATISEAKERAYAGAAKERGSEIIIGLLNGKFQITEPIVFGPALANGNSITIKAVKGSRPVISGGIHLSSWEKTTKGWWETNAPVLAKVNPRELFVNGQRAKRARFPNEGYLRVKQVGVNRRTNFVFERNDFPIPEFVSNVELVVLHDWSISRNRVKEIDQTENRLFTKDSIGARDPAFFNLDHWEPNPRYFLENAVEFIDEDFEWVFNSEQNKIVMRFPANINPNQENIVVPVSEGLIQLQGSEDSPVQNIRFEGITFCHSLWNIPEEGYCGVQACNFDPRPERGGWAVVPAAISAEWAENCSFNDCKVSGVGGSGIWFGTGCKNNTISNSVFDDISGNGIMIGEGRDREINGLKWWKAAPQQVAVKNIVSNCLVTNCGVQFFGAVGVWCGLTAETTIKYNEIFDLPYTGISVGWMWSPEKTPCRENTIDNNHIHHIMNILSDGGGIYMLGLQPGSKIVNNRINDVKINAGRAESNGMFLDEGTTDVVIENNLIYNIAKSPLRFHRATTNLVKNNALFCKKENPPIRYNTTNEEDIRKVENDIFYENDTAYEKELETAIEKWK